MTNPRPSNSCAALIEASEGFMPRVYNDPVGIATIAYGHKILSGESFPNGVTQSQGQTLMVVDIQKAYNSMCTLVKVSLTQGQVDALTDFVYNLGEGALASSTLLKYLNSGEYDSAAEQLLLWDHGSVNGQMEVLAGLKARRQAEFTLWKSS